jgi:manganese transport protein
MNSTSTVDKTTLTERTSAGIQAVLDGQRHGARSAMLFAGPAVIASIAYMDPGNFATNIEAGAQFGYTLLWVVVAANLIAMLFQALSAKLGIVTGRNLAELSREHFPTPTVYAMWVVSEIAAMATDLAEFLGGALGLSLMFKIPLMVGMVLTAIITLALLVFNRKGFRPMELIIGAIVAVIALCYVIELFIAPVDWKQVGLHSVLPSLPNNAALMIAVGIVGATVMPHAIYLHSGLTQIRPKGTCARERRLLLRFSNREVVIALCMAGLINMAMLIMAAAVFHNTHPEIAEIETAYHTLTPLLGGAAALVFLISLISAGISSSVVGTMAGQLIMQGFVGFRVPVWVRRVVTMAPAFVVIGLGVDPTQALVISQVVLSFALPIPMITLLLLVRRTDLMGEFATRGFVYAAAVAATVLVLALNTVLLYQSF